MPQQKHVMRGYTLFELLVVLAVIAFLAALTPSLIAGSRGGAETKALAHALEDALRLARSRAITENREAFVFIDTDAGRYRIGADAQWAEIPNGSSLSITAPIIAANDDAAAIMYYPDGSSAGGEIRIQGKKRVWLIKATLNGKITIDEAPQ